MCLLDRIFLLTRHFLLHHHKFLVFFLPLHTLFLNVLCPSFSSTILLNSGTFKSQSRASFHFHPMIYSRASNSVREVSSKSATYATGPRIYLQPWPLLTSRPVFYLFSRYHHLDVQKLITFNVSKVTKCAIYFFPCSIPYWKRHPSLIYKARNLSHSDYLSFCLYLVQ